MYGAIRCRNQHEFRSKTLETFTYIFTEIELKSIFKFKLSNWKKNKYTQRFSKINIQNS